MTPRRSQSVGVSDSRRFKLLIEAVTDYAIFMLDPNGFVASWNPGAERIKGYSASEIIGHHYSRFFTNEDRAAGIPDRFLGEARAHGRVESEGWRLRKDGTRFWGLAVLQPVLESNGELIGYAEIMRDITERRAEYEALRESELRFRLLVQGVVEYAIFMLDPSGVVVSWNAGAERMKGYAPAEIIGQHFSRFYTKEDRLAGLPARVLDMVTREDRYEAEGWRVRKDGSRFWAAVVMNAIRDPGGELLGIAKITRDITERRETQKALQESERQFRLLVSGVTDYALFMVDPNGIVTNWNAGAQRIKGYTANEIIGQHFSRFYTETDRSRGLPARSLNCAREQGRFEAEGWRVRKDGSPFWASVVIDPIRDEDGQLIGYAKITRDITERREAQQRLQEAQAQLAQAQKMEALGQLTGGVAHDFNNLLMIVGGNIGTIKKRVSDDPKLLRAAESIELAAQRGASLTRQLLTFSKRQSLNPVRVDLQQEMESLRILLMGSVGSPIRLIASAPPNVWPIEVDLSEFELAVVNLALNSRDAMPDGGTITITAENMELKAADTPDKLEGDFVAITVADTGCGIPEDVLPRVFDPFYTTKGAERGTGLGLSQAYGFAHQSGGTILIASTLGLGTRVTLFLPRARAEPSRTVLEEEPDEHVGEGRVLLVEDNPDVLQISKEMLEQLGYTVRAVTEARDALKELEITTFALIFSDIVIAGPINGLALARMIRERRPDVPIVLATGYSNAADEAGREFVVLRKPFQVIELGRAFAKAKARMTQGGANLLNFPDGKRERR